MTNQIGTKYKFKVNSGTDQEVWGVYIDFQSIHSKWTIDAILQHMGFNVTTENPNVMMRENHNTQSYEYINICQDGYILHLLHSAFVKRQIQDQYLSSR